MISDLRLNMMAGVSDDELLNRLTDSDLESLTLWGNNSAVELLPRELCKLLQALEKGEKTSLAQETEEKLFKTRSQLYYKNFPPKKTGRGRLVVFEGLDGSGKDTQVRLAVDFLKKTRRIYETAEPTISVTGGIIRDALGGFVQRTQSELTALFLADRIFHNTNSVNGITKLLNDNVDVVCNRYYYSSFAYQGTECDIEWVMNSNLGCPEIEKPDLCIFFDVDPKKCLERIEKGRMNIEIFEKAETLQKIREKFLEVFRLLNERENIVVIDADRPIEVIAEEVREVLSQLFDK